MNTSRIFLMDVTRGLAVFVMIIVHTVLIFGNVDFQEGSNFGKIFHLLAQCTAAFLLCMGAAFIITRHTTLSYAIKRGVLAIVAGYVLNSFRYIIPLMLGILPEEYLAMYNMAYPITYNEYRYFFLTGDILQMAGISFIVLGFVRHYIKNKYIVLALAIGVVCVLPSIRGFRFEGGTDGALYWVNYACDLLWGATWKVWFPLFPWISNILVGMAFGLHFLDINRDEKRLVHDGGIVGVIILLIGLALCSTNWKYHFPNFYHTGPGGAILLMGANMVFLYIMNFIVAQPFMNVAWYKRVLTYLSKHVTMIYIVQWVVVSWSMGIFGYHQSSWIELMALIPLMLIVSIGLEWLARNVVTYIAAAIQQKKAT